MPAQEQTYRNQRALHIVFAVSSVLMALSTVWMIGEDHYREWKTLQRDFAQLDAAKAKRDTVVASEQDLEELRQKLRAARDEASGNVNDLPRRIRNRRGRVQGVEQEYGFHRAERDSIASFYAIALENNRPDEVAEYSERLDELDQDIDRLRRDLETATDELDAAEGELTEINKQADELQSDITEKEKDIDQLKNREWTFWSAIRSWPLLDAFAPATKIEQVVPEELTIDFNFRSVPRFDRCMTCHQGIDTVTRQGGPAFDEQVVKDPELTESKYHEAFKTHPHPELFAGANSPHPRETFGCTICHEGQGSGTTFIFASHTPDSVEQEEDWREQFGWYDVHYWEHKMLRSRFVQASCVKCHPHVVDLEHSRFGNTAEKLVRGYNIVRQYGCFGCHEINGYEQGRLIGPDLRLEPQTPEERAKAKEDVSKPPGTMRKVGPSLRRLAEKILDDSWTESWIMLPKGFRPSTRMPQFYGLTNNDGEHPGSDSTDPDRAAVEVVAMSNYLYRLSREYLDEVPRIKGLDREQYTGMVNRLAELEIALNDRSRQLTQQDKKQLEQLRAQVPLRHVQLLEDPPLEIDPDDGDQKDRGRKLFIERGCLACHSHSSVPSSEYPLATADFGPDLSNIRIKLQAKDGQLNTKWLFNWLKDPKLHNPRGFMPDLQLTDQEAADIAAWLLSVPGEFAEKLTPEVNDISVLDEVIGRYLRKTTSLGQTEQIIKRGIRADELARFGEDERMLATPEDEDAAVLHARKLAYIGKKTIARMGCYGCHEIPGFETAKPIGVALYNWGRKARLDPEKLEFGHVVELLEEEHERVPEDQERDFELFLEAIKEHRGEGFLWQKLRDPRSYDFMTLRGWEDRLRMPRFPFAEDPEEVEAVMTFVLGLMGDPSIPAHFRNLPTGPALAKVEGAKLLTKYNCVGCHVLEMPKYVFDPAKLDPELPDPSRLHNQEYPEVVQAQSARARDAKVPGATGLMGVHAMLLGPDVPALSLPGPDDLLEDDFVALVLWEPVTVTHNDEQYTYITGDRIAFEARALELERSQKASGGQFAELLVGHLARGSGKTLQEMWFQVPPPLVGEGAKVQPAWLHQFLLNPISIRPAVVLRMPKFNMTSDEAAALAGYFAAVDQVEFPYEFIRERDDAYLLAKGLEHPNYLGDAWKLLTLQSQTAKLCANCHNVGQVIVGGSPEGLGPDLWLTPDRLRPNWLLEWTAAPPRILPYTGMPKNFLPGNRQYQEHFPGSSFEQITGVRDALINYHRIQQALAANPQAAQTSTGGN